MLPVSESMLRTRLQSPCFGPVFRVHAARVHLRDPSMSMSHLRSHVFSSHVFMLSMSSVAMSSCCPSSDPCCQSCTMSVTRVVHEPSSDHVIGIHCPSVSPLLSGSMSMFFTVRSIGNHQFPDFKIVACCLSLSGQKVVLPYPRQRSRRQ